MGSPKIKIKSPGDVKKLGTIMGVWAHPDDETYTCGGLLATAIRNGQEVVCVTATKGELGIQDAKRWPPEKLGEIRAKELKDAMEALGVKTHRWLDYKDGFCINVPLEDAVNRVAGLIEKYRPDTILTFGPDGMTGHDDHKAVSNWVKEAVKLSKLKPAVYHAVEYTERYEKYFKAADERLNIYFNIDKPPLKDEADCDIFLPLEPSVLECKCHALNCMPSQTESMFKVLTHEEIHAALNTETFVESD